MTAKIKGAMPVVYITPQAKQKLDLYIKCCKQEISGFGTVERYERSFLITDVFIFNQECSTSNSDMSSEDVSKYLVEAVNEGIDPSTIKLFWHSHADGGVFWSGVDNDCIDQLSTSWLLSIVGNHSGQYLVRLDLYEFARVTLDELDFRVFTPPIEGLKEAIEAEIKEKVKVKSYAGTAYWNKRYPAHQPYSGHVTYPETGRQAYENAKLNQIRGNKGKKEEEEEGGDNRPLYDPYYPYGQYGDYY